MRSTVVISERFTQSWVFALDHLRGRWPDAEIILLPADDPRSAEEFVSNTEEVDRLVSLGVPVTVDSLMSFRNLKEFGTANIPDHGPTTSVAWKDVKQYADQAGIQVYHQRSEGFWAESVSECALALTLCGMRRIPQKHHEIIANHEPWDHSFQSGPDGPTRGVQFSDDQRFTCGTVEGKSVRVVGVGNIGSRYCSFMKMLGADVAAYDPFAPDPCFHRAGARKVYHLDELVKDAEIFAPMVPITESTIGLITADHIRALPKGCLVILVTRARICDMEVIRQRVVADEIALAADVHDLEPLPLDDPIIGRHNVVHTPHIAGRTKEAGDLWVDMLLDQFEPDGERAIL